MEQRKTLKIVLFFFFLILAIFFAYSDSSINPQGVDTLNSPAQHICQDFNGTLHTVYEGASNTIGYSYSYNGATWVNKTIYTSPQTIIGTGIVCNGTQGVLAYFYEENVAGTDNISGFYSGDGGASFGDYFSLMSVANSPPGTSLTRPSCISDKNSIIQCCAINDTSWNLVYVNSSSWNTPRIIYSNASDDVDWCDIETDKNNNIYIVGVGTDKDDLSIWASNNNWVQKIIYDGVSTGLEAETVSIVISDVNIYVAWQDLDDLQFANSTIDTNATIWTTQEIDINDSFYPSMTANDEGEIRILYTNDSTFGGNPLIYTANSSDYGKTWTSRTRLKEGANYPSPMYQNYPYNPTVSGGMSRTRNVLHYLYTLSTGINYSNASISYSKANINFVTPSTKYWVNSTLPLFVNVSIRDPYNESIILEYLKDIGNRTNITLAKPASEDYGNWTIPDIYFGNSTIKAYANDSNSIWVSAEITVYDNSSFTPTNVTIPALTINTSLITAYSADGLNCSTTATDNTNTTPTVEFKWFNQSSSGEGMALGNVNVSCTSGSICKTTVTLNNLKHFDNYTCSVRAWDGEYWSRRVNSTKQYVNNTKPTMTSTELNKTSGVLNTDDLNCSAVGKADNDLEDTLVYHYEWYKIGVAQNFDTRNISSPKLTANDDWYCEAWVIDSYHNSSKYTSSTIIVGSVESVPVIIKANATSGLTGLNSTSSIPTNNNSFINLTVQFTDINTNNWTAYFCNDPSFTVCKANISNELFCKSSKNLSDKVLSCIYNVSGYTGENPRTYYAFVLDNTSLVSSARSETFEVNHPPNMPTLVYPPTNKHISINYTWINWTDLDPNGDVINYTVYIDNSSGFNFTYNGTNAFFNFSAPSENITYYWRVYAFDSHNYGYNNVTLGNITTDFTAPIVSITAPVAQTYTSTTIDLDYSSSDTHLKSCYYSVDYADSGSVYISNTTITCNVVTTFTAVAYAGGYIFNAYAEDFANTITRDYVNFTVSTPSPSPTTTGGSTPVPEEKQLGLLCNVSGQDWSAKTDKGTSSYELYTFPENNIPRKKLILLKNKGLNATLSLQCESNSTICDYITLDKKDIPMIPNELVTEEVSMDINTPKNSTYGSNYAFNIAITDNIACKELLAVNLKVSYLGLFWKFYKLEFSRLSESYEDFYLRAIYPTFLIFIFVTLILSYLNPMKRDFPIANFFIASSTGLLVSTLFLVLV